MKIAIITNAFSCLPPYGTGAVERLWYDVGEEFATSGHEVCFYSKRPSSGEYKSKSKIVVLSGFERTGSLIKDLLLEFIFSFKAFMALEKTEVLIINSFWAPFWARLFRKKYIVSVFNVARFPKGQYKYYLNIDRLSCVSTAVNNALVRQTPAAKNIVKVIPNPVNTEVFSYKEKAVDNDRLNILYTGRVHPEKGLDLLIKAFAHLRKKYPDLTLSIVGPRDVENGGGGGKFIQELAKMAGDNPIAWVDAVRDRKALAEMIYECDIYCYPSVAETGESFGVAPLEAMACGRATIVSALECFQDFIIDGETGLVFNHRAPNAVDLLAEKIEMLILDKKLRHELGVRGSQVAHGSFSTATIAKKYLEDFNELLDAKNKNGAWP